MTSTEIRDKADSCLASFDLLLRIEAEVGDGDKADKQHDGEFRSEDHLARFRIWAGNIGVFAIGSASLDYRLRASASLKKDLLHFLSALQDFVKKATEALQPEIISVNFHEEGSTDQPTASSTISSSFRGTEIDSALEEVLVAITPLEKRLQGVERAIDTLYRVSILIRQPSIISQNKKAEEFRIKDAEDNDVTDRFQDFVRTYVAHKLPKAPQELQDRLARGVVTRRKRVLYRQHHQKKLTNGTNEGTKEDSRQEIINYNHGGASTITIGAFNPIDSELIAGLAEKTSKSKKPAVLSHTTASALPKETSKVSRADEEEGSKAPTNISYAFIKGNLIPVPDPPKPAQNSKEFECPYCCIMLPIKEAKALRWRRHVMDDLEPYACVFRDCDSADAFLPSRSSWVNHLQCHTSQWTCTFATHPPLSFQSEQTYQTHLSKQHAGSYTESQLATLTDLARDLTVAIFTNCPLCDYYPSDQEVKGETSNGRSDDSIEKIKSDLVVSHLVAHLESLAVFALPPEEFDRPSSAGSVTSKAGAISTQSEESIKIDLIDALSVQSLDEDLYPGSDSVFTPPSSDAEEDADSPPDAYEDWDCLPQFTYHGHDRDPILQPLLRRLFLTSSSSTNEQHGPTLPAFMVPVSRNKSFFGRKLQLNTMRQALCASAAVDFGAKRPLSFPRTYTVYGPGGMGKTQIAAEFVSQHREEFDAVFWVRAEDSDKIAQDFKNIAIQLGLLDGQSLDAQDMAYARDVLKRWLVRPVKNLSSKGASVQTNLASWLLVFDGVGSGDVLNEVWPYDGPGSILITSRNPHTWSTSIELRPWNTLEAMEYIFQRTGIERSDEEKSAASVIANRLGGLPLALASVVGIMIHKEITLKQFVQRYGKREGDEEFLQWTGIDGGPAAVEFQYNVASVWAFDSLGAGLLLINTFALLDPDGVPDSLFTGTIGPDAVGDVAQLKAQFREGKEELIARSLLTGDKREQKLMVHRLVQEACRSKMRPTELRRTFLTCVGLVAEQWPFEELTWRHGTARWGICEELFPHVQKLKSFFSAITPAPESFEDYTFAKLLIDAGWYLHERGNSSEAIYFNNMAQSICESFKLRLLEEPESAIGTPISLSQLNKSLSEILHNRGCIALEINEPNDALHYHKLFNTRMKKALSGDKEMDDMRLGISWNELGNAYMRNDDWATGEQCYVESIKVMKRLRNYTKSTVSLPLANLGLSYWFQNKLDEAESKLLKGLKDRDEELGENDKGSFIPGRFLHALGNVRGSQGQREEAHGYHRRLLLHYKATLGHRHHRTADAYTKLAEHHILKGEQETAILYLDAAQNAYSLSNNFEPERMRAIWLRTKAFKALGRYTEADAELTKCYSIYSWIMADRPADQSLIKMKASDLVDGDINRLIAFWSR